MDSLSKILELLSGRDPQRGVNTQDAAEDNIRRNVVSSELTSEEQSKLIEISKIIGHTIEIGKFTTDAKHRNVARIFADEVAKAFEVGRYKPYALDILDSVSTEQIQQRQTQQSVNVDIPGAEKSKSILGSVAGLIDNVSGLMGGIIPGIIGAVAIIGGAAILTALVYKLPEIITSLSSGLPAFGKFIEFIYPIIKDFVTTLLPKLEEFIVGVLPAFGNLIKDVTPLVTNLFGTLYNNLTKIVDIVATEMGVLLKFVVGETHTTIRYLSNLFKGVFDNILDKGTIIADKILGAFGKVVEFVGSNLQPTLGKLKDVVLGLSDNAFKIANVFSVTLFGAFKLVRDVIGEISGGFDKMMIFFDKLVSLSASNIKEVTSSIFELGKAFGALAAISVGSSVAGAMTSVLNIFGSEGPIDRIISLSAKAVNIGNAARSIGSITTALSLFFAVDTTNAEKFDTFFYNLNQINPEQLALTGQAFGVLQEKIGFLAGYSTNIGIVSEGIQTLLKSTDGLKILDESLKGIFQSVSKLDTTKIQTITIRAEVTQIHKTNEILSTQVDIQKKILQETINNGKLISQIKISSGGNTTNVNGGGESGSISSSSSRSPRQLFNNSAYSFGIK
jgi:hypothetical protein